MPTPSSLVAILLLLVPAAAQRSRTPERSPELEHGTFETHRFRSEALGRDLDYGIYLPAGYAEAEEKARYPLVVWLHGMFEDHRRFHVRGGTEVLDRLIGDGTFPEVVFVTAEGGRRSFYVNGAESGAWEDAVVEDLLPHLQQEYRIAEERGQRALMGVSMGGYGALKIAFKRPELFGVVAAHSAAVMPRDPDELDERFPWLERWGGGRRALGSVFGDPIDEKRWQRENLLLIAEELDAEELDGLKIYFDVGDEDRYGFDGPNRELHRALEEQGIPHEFRVVEGGNHGWRAGYNQQALPHSLGFVTAALATARGTSGLEGLLRGGRDG